jgi:predicted nucleotidyltransferase
MFNCRIGARIDPLAKMNFDPVIPIIEYDPRIIAVYALGSAVRDELRPDSDIDLALLLNPGATLSTLERVSLAFRLSDVLSHPVDLGVLSAMNLVYTRQAVLSGRCIYRRPFALDALLVANLLGLYASFHEERQEVLNAYTTR